MPASLEFSRKLVVLIKRVCCCWCIDIPNSDSDVCHKSVHVEGQMAQNLPGQEDFGPKQSKERAVEQVTKAK